MKLRSDTLTGTVIFGDEYFKSLKVKKKPTAEKSTTENPRRKRQIFVVDNIFCRKVRYSKHQGNGF